jgi:hypothetical protein
LVFQDGIESLFGDHGRVLSSFWMNVVVQVFHDSRKDFFGLFVQVANSNTRSQNSIVGMFGLF